MTTPTRFTILILFLGLTGCGSLLSATQSGDLQAVKKRLASGESPNADPGDEPPLCVATAAERVEIVQALLDAKAETNVPCPTSDGTGVADDPLFIAVKLRNKKIVEMLVAARNDRALIRSAFHVIAYKGDPDQLTSVILDTLKASFGETAMKAAMMNDDEPLLFLAARYGNVAMVEQLLARGADPNAMGPEYGDRWPTLFEARSSKAADRIVALLLKAGANADVKTKNGLDYEAARAWAGAQARETLEKVAAEQEAEARERRERKREEREEEKRNAAAGQAAFDSYSRAILGDGTSSSAPSPSGAQVPSAARASGGSTTGSSPSTDGPGTSSSPSTSSSGARSSTKPSSPEGAGANKAAADKAAADKAAADKAAAAAESERRQREYETSLKNGMSARVTTGYPSCASSPKEYCVVAQWPSGVRAPGNGANLADVTFRARCRGTSAWQTGRISHVSPPPASVVPAYLQPKPSCPVSDVEVDVTDVTLSP